MNKADQRLYKERLLALRAELRNDVRQMADSVLQKTPAEANGNSSVMPMHMAEIGSDNFEREFTLSLLSTKDRTLDQIERALERMEDGFYGVCDQCGTRIPKTRLKAIPYTSRCVRCASSQG
ncbi:MAG: TraR/DksA C4-type zinc finger protein [Pirellulaceae bacterium]|nr:TraR/DksA C4-type zinc finger protein [Pirellulaceae bacterium]